MPKLVQYTKRLILKLKLSRLLMILKTADLSYLWKSPLRKVSPLCLNSEESDYSFFRLKQSRAQSDWRIFASNSQRGSVGRGASKFQWYDWWFGQDIIKVRSQQLGTLSPYVFLNCDTSELQALNQMCDQLHNLDLVELEKTIEIMHTSPKISRKAKVK